VTAPIPGSLRPAASLQLDPQDLWSDSCSRERVGAERGPRPLTSCALRGGS
jgi:hypothetical protein